MSTCGVQTLSQDLTGGPPDTEVIMEMDNFGASFSTIKS